MKVGTAIVAVAIAFAVTTILEDAWGQVLFLATVTAVFMVVAILYREEKRLPLLADPMVLVCAFFAQFYVIGPVSLPLFDWHIHIALPVELVTRTMLAFLLLFGCFFVAYQSRLGPIVAGVLPEFRPGRLKLSGRVAEALILGMSLLGCWLFVQDRGGLFELLGTGYGQTKISGIYQLPFHTLILGTIVMAWRLADSPRVGKLDWVVFGGLLAGELVFYGVVLGARNRLFFLFFGLYTVWTMRRGVQRWWKWATIPALVVLLVFFSWWGTSRARSVEQMVQGSWDPRFESQAPYMGYFTSVAEPFAVACLVMNLFPEVEPFRHGRTLLVTLLGFIPRSVWPDKPIGFGKEVTRFTDGVFYNPVYGHSLTITFLGDFWVNGGWFGVVIGGLVFGVLARAVATYSARGMENGALQTDPARALGAAVFAASLAEIRADSATILGFWAMMLPWLLLALSFFRMDYSRERDAAVRRAESAAIRPDGAVLPAP